MTEKQKEEEKGERDRGMMWLLTKPPNIHPRNICTRVKPDSRSPNYPVPVRKASA